MSSIRIQLGAISSFFRSAHQVIWIGPVFVLAAGAGSVIFYLLWKVLLGMATGPAEAFVSHKTMFMISAGISLFLYFSFVTWMASMMWIHMNEVFYRAKARQRIFGHVMESFSCFVHAAAIVSGVAVLTWLLSVAVVPRLPGPNGAQTVILAVLVAAIFSPLLARLWYLPVVGAIEPGHAWRKIQESTQGRGGMLILTIPLQAVLVVVSIGVFRQIVWPWISPVVSALKTGNYYTVGDMANLISGFWGIDLIASVVFFALVAGPFLSLLSALQVAVVRSYVASDEDSVTIDAASRSPELEVEDEAAEEMIALSALDSNETFDGDPLADLEASTDGSSAEDDPLRFPDLN